MEWIERHLKTLAVGFLALVVVGLFALWVMERRDKHAACIEALKSSDVGDLARHLLCR